MAIPLPADDCLHCTPGKGEVTFADGELTDGGWFCRENPPVLPTPPSLSRRLIDAWIADTLPS